MLKQAGYTRYTESTYLCDMCGRTIGLNNKFTYNRIANKKSRKAFDLCEQCDHKLTKSIEDYASRHKNNKRRED